MATHSSILAWKIPWTEESGRLQSMRSQRVGHDWATSPVLKNLPCNAEDEGLIPGWGTKIVHAKGQFTLQLVSPQVATRECVHHNKRSCMLQLRLDAAKIKLNKYLKVANTAEISPLIPGFTLTLPVGLPSCICSTAPATTLSRQ